MNKLKSATKWIALIGNYYFDDKEFQEKANNFIITFNELGLKGNEMFLAFEISSIIEEYVKILVSIATKHGILAVSFDNERTDDIYDKLSNLYKKKEYIENILENYFQYKKLKFSDNI